MSELAATRSTCIRRKVGAVLVKNRRVISTGYNGAPAGHQHCQDIGCLREQLNVPSGERHELCRGVHAEQNVIIQAAFHGIQTMFSTLYCTVKPCSICAKMIANAGILNVVYRDDYNEKMADDVLHGMLRKFEG
jgi:dCMP deaminase